MSKSIYFVGKPYPGAYKLPPYTNPDYKVGVLLDKTVRLKHRDKYEDVIEVDFSSPESIIRSLPEGLAVDALICTYENYIVGKSYLAKMLKVNAPSVESAKMSTDKYLMRQAFMKADPSTTPRFALVSSAKEAAEAARRLSYPLILKPTNLVKSLLVLRCNDEQELINNFTYAQQNLGQIYEKQRVHGRQPQMIIEEYIEGRTCSIAAFVDKDGQPSFCDGIVELENASDIGVDDNYIYRRGLPAGLGKKLSDRLFEVAEIGIKALGMTSTPAHVELIYSDEKVKLIEIGARIGGYRPRMYEKSYGIDLLGQEIINALGQEVKLSGELAAYSAVYELFPDKVGIFMAIDGLDSPDGFDYYSVKARPGDHIGPAKNGFKAAAIVIVSSQDKNVFVKLCAKAEKLKVRLEA